MTDEKFLFVSDCAEKKRTARGAFNKRVHTGKGGRAMMPSDYLTRKELKKMNSEVKSYNLGKPMTWKEFKSMPNDIRREYLEKIIAIGARCTWAAKMFGVSDASVTQEARTLGVHFPHCSRVNPEKLARWREFLKDEEDIAPAEKAEEPAAVFSCAGTADDAVPVSEPENPPMDIPEEPVLQGPTRGTIQFENVITTESLNAIYSLLPKNSIKRLTVTWEL